MVHQQTLVLNPIPTLVFGAVIASWFVFWLWFLFRWKNPKAAVAKRRGLSAWGLFFQGCGYFLVFGMKRQMFTPLFPMPDAAEITLGIVTIAIAAGSMWMWIVAIRTLGKQWGLVARVMEGHQLITAGPYGTVRNPIYLSMFGMLVATGLALSTWWALLLAAILSAIGTQIRIRNEEKVLRESFGAEFDAYLREVPAMFPRIF
ncbi:MAG: isoprenylcysteine carboxylmethyltransferase family protein [Candidatus Acidiferrales bacterium]